ncbi:MAG: bifunctional DNA primase/polymerase, partial [Dehalococcoidia bacterium]|nr:bifunctional DNA primase/polymerase [Dehalococcoidia bacterium]
HPEDLRSGAISASTDPEVIARWWARWPAANIGLVTGSRAGWFALDVDPRHGGDDSLADLEHRHGRLPETVEALTGGGGRHLLFSLPGFQVPNHTGAGALAPGLEVKGDGGYIVAPPSRHGSGRPYAWESSSAPGVVAIAAPPAWLVTGLQRTPPKRTAGDPGAPIPEGQRNVRLTSLAGLMRRGGFDVEEMEAALRVLNLARCRPPLLDEEVRRIAVSVGRYEPEEASDWRCNAAGAFTGFEPLVRIGTDPPRYLAHPCGHELELALIELAEFKPFKLRCISELSFVPVFPCAIGADGKPLSVQATWEREFLVPALKRMTVREEAPADAGEAGATWDAVQLFLRDARHADDKTGVYDERLALLDGQWYFRGRVLRKWLAMNNLDRGVTADGLWGVVRRHGGAPALLRTPKGVVRCWMIPDPNETHGAEDTDEMLQT